MTEVMRSLLLRPSRTTFFLGVQEVELAQVLGHRAAHRALEGEVNSSSVFRCGTRAALLRDSPPWLSREATWVESSTSAKRS